MAKASLRKIIEYAITNYNFCAGERQSNLLVIGEADEINCDVDTGVSANTMRGPNGVSWSVVVIDRGNGEYLCYYNVANMAKIIDYINPFAYIPRVKQVMTAEEAVSAASSFIIKNFTAHDVEIDGVTVRLHIAGK